MFQKSTYLSPSVRISGYTTECNFVTTVTGGNITPGEDPGSGGSWDFGDDD